MASDLGPTLCPPSYSKIPLGKEIYFCDGHVFLFFDDLTLNENLPSSAWSTETITLGQDHME